MYFFQLFLVLKEQYLMKHTNFSYSLNTTLSKFEIYVFFSVCQKRGFFLQKHMSNGLTILIDGRSNHILLRVEGFFGLKSNHASKWHFRKFDSFYFVQLKRIGLVMFYNSQSSLIARNFDDNWSMKRTNWPYRNSSFDMHVVR